jgi:hypothetical protein
LHLVWGRIQKWAKEVDQEGAPQIDGDAVIDWRQRAPKGKKIKTTMFT